jgi:hypothetical protein
MKEIFRLPIQRRILLLVFISSFSFSTKIFAQNRFSETKKSLEIDLAFTYGYALGQKIIVNKMSAVFPKNSKDLNSSPLAHASRVCLYQFA